MIVGIGVDVVDVARFERAIARTPGLRDRLFAVSERELHPRSLAARFAAKEALVKALRGPDGLRWHDMVVVTGADGEPTFALSGAVASAAEALGAGTVHVSMSHDAGIATAFVVLDGIADGASS